MNEESTSADLTNRTIQGVSWSGISQAVTQSCTWIISIVLARILGPHAYGVIGMITVFTSFAILFAGLGFGMAIVQRKTIEERHLSAAFWMNAATGTLITLIMIAVAPLIASFYNEPLLTPLTRVIAIRFLLDSLGIVQSALLRRAMRFRTLGAIQISSSILSGLIALAMALGDMGVWSLVALTLGFAFFPLPMLWWLAQWRPAWSFEWKAGKELFAFSGPVVALDVVTYWARSLDTLLIGRFMGAAALGIYSRATSLMLMPLTQVSSVVGNVMIPALSSIQEDKIRVSRNYIRAVRLVGFITFPMMVGLFVVSDHLILALLGLKWAPVIPILRIMCGVGILNSVGRWDWICLSQGRTSLYFYIGAIVSLVTAIAFIIGLHWGIHGMAWACLISNLIVWYPAWRAGGRIINLSFKEMLGAVSSVFACAMSMGAIVAGLRYLIPNSFPNWACLVLEVFLGGVAYLSLVISFRVKAWEEGRDLVMGMLAKVGRRKSILPQTIAVNPP
jgi:PST family polysaccharide transporter